MIFRAMVSAYPKELPERAQDERVVFIEAANRNDARDRLPALAAATWSVPVESVDICNFEAEFELMASPFAEGLPREHAIFVTGWGDGKTTFVNGETPCGHAVFFLAGELDRVMNAYLSLPRKSSGSN
ncbi:hypothetical protein DENIT_20149 [Pseudomonas veronii]|uniref:hypothetical protein n=1 Tax=Pseudomonas veronii TaxID=76761 RepID=UPI00176326FA|nr:hypothetical protein [Pseudomonas veronii]CAD0264260.1 hypothetical protein DENIT_20149 [Pseudomonas veronii]